MAKNDDDDFSSFLPAVTKEDSMELSSDFQTLVSSLPEPKEVTVEMSEEEVDKQDLTVINNYMRINSFAMRSATSVGSILLLGEQAQKLIRLRRQVKKIDTKGKLSVTWDV